MQKQKKHLKMSHVQIIALGFFLIIMAGTLLLMLPAATKNGQGASFLDALFTATSASCVTGLVVQDTSTYWSGFGQAAILLMIQIGGLGFMTIATMFFMLLKRRVHLRGRELLTESINGNQVGGIMKLAKKILIGTFLIEGIGAMILMIRFVPLYGKQGVWMSVFHSVSAFCNGGFDLMGEHTGVYSSLTAFADDWLVNSVIMFLIVIGGVGFVVWDDMLTHKWHLKRYHLHSKIVLYMTNVLIFGGALLFYFVERNATGAGMSAGNQILTSLFDSITARTAGFNTVDTAALSDAGKLITIALMFIGGSPGSTAGGVKTTTIMVLMLYSFSYMRKDRGTSVFGRSLEEDALRKASAVFFTNLMLALGVTIIISSIQSFPMLDLMFETFSAIGTVGMSTGLTRELHDISRVLIIFLMYCGRVGSLSFANALAGRRKTVPVKDAVEKITIG
ncbi:MAG: TrkH family potassium uptake protein [Lachnospiraceae bacterium]|nr:TrkH family potassium uptake protein [Lachnospiraceae bacterium]